MYQPKWIGIKELAAQWDQTSNQILQHAVDGVLPIYFPFEGLALPDESLHSNHDASLEARLQDVRRHAAGYARMVLELSGAPGDEHDEQIAQTYLDLMLSAQAREQELYDELIERPEKRENCVTREHLRLDKDVIWSIYQVGAAPHPSAAWAVDDKATHKDVPERRVYLEPLPGKGGFQRERLTAADLFVPVSALPSLSIAPVAASSSRRQWWLAEAEEISANVRSKGPALSEKAVSKEVATRLRLKYAPVGGLSLPGKKKAIPTSETIRKKLRESAK